MPRRLRPEDYTAGWVCALPVELAAALEMLDEEHGDVQLQRGSKDENIYALGSIGSHNVVIVCLPEGRIGNNVAATVAAQMKATFKGIRFGLMVGIGGGVPCKERDIRLGDIVVSRPEQKLAGVVQYDMGKITQNGFERTGFLNAPPYVLLSAVSRVRANTIRGQSKLDKYISKLEQNPKFQRSKAGCDILFDAGYEHQNGSTCEQCDAGRQEARQQRERSDTVTVHYGTIASGNQVMRSATQRDKVSADLGGVLCFEMEAAGLMNDFPCLVIRGICDYADSHKNKRWQAYAAGTAAAYAKELLVVIPPADVTRTHPTNEVLCAERTYYEQSRSPNGISVKRRRVDLAQSQESSASQPPFLGKDQLQMLLNSLAFIQSEMRSMTITTAHKSTCEWLLRSSQFLSWLDETELDNHHGFLWIKGKPGTGKSTLMKFALNYARKQYIGSTLLSFFFNARGAELEKSTIGTYRSLLLQLLKQLPDGEQSSVFGLLGLATPNDGEEYLANYQWSTEILMALFEKAIMSLRKISPRQLPVMCFIDALDECDQDQIRDMVHFFEKTCELAMSNGVRFLVCLSSRHYPHITIEKGLSLVLDRHEEHTRDISRYIKDKLRIGNSNSAQKIYQEIEEKASGIFMWVIIVVRILNTEYDRGRVYALQRRLRTIPTNLHDLFRDILTRDSDNKNHLLLCIQWVLFAKEPLSPEQLYFAILSGTEPDAPLEWDRGEVTTDVIKRFILNYSKGLTEVTSSELARVQFIHESVRDYLLKENGLYNIWPELGINIQGQSHERLKQCCLSHSEMVLNAIPQDILNAPHKASSRKEAAARRDRTLGAFPFLNYAVHNLLYHADAAAVNAVPQNDFLDNFQMSPYINLHNLFQKHGIRKHTYHASLLYILAEFNMVNLIKGYSLSSRCLDVEDERYGCPLFAAIATGSQEAAYELLDSITMDQTDATDLKHLDNYMSRRKTTQHSASPELNYSKTGGLLVGALKLRHEGLAIHLIESGRANNLYEGALLHSACENKCMRVVERLLDFDIRLLHSKDRRGATPLYVACETQNEALVRKLLDRGADVNMLNGGLGHALKPVSERGHKEIVELLLDRGADLNAQSNLHETPLRAAILNGHVDTVQLLLVRGADLNALGTAFCGTIVVKASLEGHQKMVELLLGGGADINTPGYYVSALQGASREGHESIVKMLLDKGVDVNASGVQSSSTALQEASRMGHENIVRMLLEKEADVNALGVGSYGTALQEASLMGHVNIVKLLLDNGSDVNAVGTARVGTALQQASREGYENIVKLLLDRGADVNLQVESLYENALEAALENKQLKIAKLLRERGAWEMTT